MKIAIPTVDGNLCLHFGHCEKFAIFHIADNAIASREDLTPPPHEPGVLPAWLGEMDVNVIIAGGMGQRAQNMFNDNNIKVVTGAPATNAEVVVKSYLDNSLITGDNTCDH